ncbi:MAG: hypothetical protein QOI47_567, partial [Actinomycetota bacterium]|nr:hypothetical protein [Actinomycetota bacterium]
MRRVVGAVVALLVLGIPSARASARVDLIVKAASVSSSRADVARQLGGHVGLVVAPDTFVVSGALAGADAPPGVRWVTPDTRYRAAREPTDVCFHTCQVALDGQVELQTVGAPAAWD